MPGPVGVNIDGDYIVRPGVFSKNNTKAMTPNRPGPGGYVGVAGPCDGGIPGTLYEFSSFPEAVSVLRRGPALSYIKRIFDPSPDENLAGASLVRFVRIGAPTVATLAAGGITFTSKDYGRHVNAISVTMAGSAGSWSATIKKASDGYSRTYTVGKAIKVLCSGTTPKITFDHVNREAKLYINGAVVATFLYPTDAVTLTNLASFINGYGNGWSAVVTGDGSMPVSYMDNPLLAAAPAITAGGTEIPASQGSLIWQVNSRDPLVTAGLATGTTYGDLAVVAETPLAGGTGTGYDTFADSDYQAALTKFEPIEIHHLFICTYSAPARAFALAHTSLMRTLTRRRWRIFYTGGPVGETPAQAIAAAQSLDGPVYYAWNGTADASPETGLAENLGSLGSAAQACGLAAGSASATPLTNKPVRASGLEVSAPTDSDIDAMLIGGVSPIAYDAFTGRATIVQAITTYQGGADVMFRKLQGLRIQDEISRGEQRILNEFKGEPFDLITGQRIKTKMEKWLDTCVRSSVNPDGFLTKGMENGEETPAWKNLTVVGQDSDFWVIDVEAHPVGESDYIFVRNRLTPATISL